MLEWERGSVRELGLDGVLRLLEQGLRESLGRMGSVGQNESRRQWQNYDFSL